jgi:hypothetical protein
MRVNVYAEEMTDRIEIVEKEIDGQVFTGLRIYLYLPVTLINERGEVKQIKGPFIHREIKAGMTVCEDDDSSAITFWGKRDLRKILVKAITELDIHYHKKEHKQPFE